MRLCRADSGNQRGAFTCTYHGWAYDIGGNLISVTHEDDAWHGDLDKSAWGCVQVTQVENYKGFIFGNWDPTAPSFTDYLGDMAWYFDVFADRFDNGLEMVGGMHKWVLNCNWKFAAEQFTTDMQHAEISHGSAFIAHDARRLPRPGGHAHRRGAVLLGGGPRLRILPRGPGPGLRARAGAGQVLDRRRASKRPPGGSARPGPRASGPPTPTSFRRSPSCPGFQTMRVWQPKGPDKMEVWAWVAVPKDAPDEVKEAWRIGMLRTFSPAGLFEQDDGENWLEIQKVLQGPHGPQVPRSTSRWVSATSASTTRTFPGKTNTCYAEMAARGMYQRWIDMMTCETLVRDRGACGRSVKPGGGR